MVDSNGDGANKIPSSSLTSYISGLSDELLIEILCRLGSSKFAVRCKCICKHWFSILNTNSSSDSYFLRRWREVHQKADREGEELPIVLLTQYRHLTLPDRYVIDDYLSLFNKELPMFKSLFKRDLSFDSIYVLATFRDLVLWCPTKTDHSVYIICNPFTKQWAVLPTTPPARPKEDIRVFLVASDNDNDLKFKVVRIFPNYTIKMEIFSSDDSSGQWREIQMGGLKYYYSLPPLSYNGMLLWLGDSSECKQVIGFIKFYPQLPLGLFQPGTKSITQTGLCGGCLRIARLVHPKNINIPSLSDQKLTVWELNINSHNQVWELLVDELSLSRVFEDQHCSTARISCRVFGFVLAFHPHDRDILYLGFTDIRHNPWMSYVCLFNLRIKTIEVIREFSGGELQITFLLEHPSWPTSIPRLPRPPT